MQAAGVKLYATMRLACASLASEIETAQSGPPIPYASMQQLYARGLAGLSGAAADCRSAISVRPDGRREHPELREQGPAEPVAGGVQHRFQGGLPGHGRDPGAARLKGPSPGRACVAAG